MIRRLGSWIRTFRGLGGPRKRDAPQRVGANIFIEGAGPWAGPQLSGQLWRSSRGVVWFSELPNVLLPEPARYGAPLFRKCSVMAASERSHRAGEFTFVNASWGVECGRCAGRPGSSTCPPGGRLVAQASGRVLMLGLPNHILKSLRSGPYHWGGYAPRNVFQVFLHADCSQFGKPVPSPFQEGLLANV
jgi:hypothetical protein